MTTSTETGVDLIAVHRLLDGHEPRPVLAHHEKQYAAHVLTGEGLTVARIAELLGVAERTVNRWRTQPVALEPAAPLAVVLPWQEYALCRQVDAGLFFPDDDSDAFPGYSRARRVCAGCTVRTDCLEEALTREGTVNARERAGMWGGLSPDQRAAVAASRRKRAAA